MILFRRPLLLSEARARVEHGVQRLYVFDLDNTLIRVPTRESGEKTYHTVTGRQWPFKRWWTVPQSLHEPFEIGPNPGMRGAFLRASSDKAGKVIVMTGRIASQEMIKTITKLLTNLGFGRFTYQDDLLLKRINEPDTLAWKKKMLSGFRRRFPDLKEVHMWDDRGAHTVAFDNHIKHLGLAPFVHHVSPAVS